MMKKLSVSDATLCRNAAMLTFKEKIEIARLEEQLGVDIIELPALENRKADTLLIRTVASFVGKSALSVCGGMTAADITATAEALSGAAHPIIRIELPLSPVGMEYTCHRKPPKLLELIDTLIGAAKDTGIPVEFCALDATRAEPQFLHDALCRAVATGATAITLCDDAAEMLPDDFAAFARETLCEFSANGTTCGVSCNDQTGMATAAAILAAKAGIDRVRTSVSDGLTPLNGFAGLIRTCGENCGFSCGIKFTKLNRIINQINHIVGGTVTESAPAARLSAADAGWTLDAKDDETAVSDAVRKLGYDLSEDDLHRVYEEFLRVADKKAVGAKELNAIVATAAMQVPQTYQLISYVVNNGNIIPASAQLHLQRDETVLDGVCIGDGPIDAAFRTIEQIIGHHYELDDFQIQSVTEGREAVGSAVVRLRENGRLYSGTGISTDIIGASIRAYLGALNKIVYEENL